MATWQHLRSSTANKRPTTSLADGRIAINTNTASPGLFFKDSAGTGIVKVGPVHVGTTAPNSVPASGGSSGNYTGEQWLDTSVSPAQMKVWNGSTWVGIVADELPVSKLQDGAARQLIQTDAAGTGVEWTSNVDVPGTLDVTSTATFDSIAQYPLGSAAAPTLTFTGDNNTGIYSPGADQVAISTNGVGRLFIDASGYVKVSNGEISQTSATGYIRLDGGSGLGLGANIVAFGESHSSAPGQLSYGTTGSGAHIFNAGGAERMRLTSTGALGLGTSSPSYTLDVSGTARITSVSPLFLGTTAGDSYIQYGANATTTNNWTVGSQADGTFRFFNGTYASGTERLRITSAGNVGIGITAPSELLSLNSSSSNAAVSIRTGGASFNSVVKFNADDTNYAGIGLENTALVMRCSNSSTPTERARIDSSGRLLVGTSSWSDTTRAVFSGNSIDNQETYLTLNRGTAATGAGGAIGFISFTNGGSSQYCASISCWTDAASGSGDNPGRLVFSTTADGASSPTERMRIDNAGNILFNNTVFSASNNGVLMGVGGNTYITATSLDVLTINRKTTDGTLVNFLQDGSSEGTISVSGTTVTYGGGHLARWSQLPDEEDPTGLLKGTVMSNLDEMCEWGEEDNEQLNKAKVSDVEGDPNVAGVFVSTSFSEDGPLDFFVAMTGDMIIRIAEGVTVQRGDLLMSAGDGTAKPQGDDIVRSKTIAKVTSAHVTCTYNDGSYCVPCVLMAC
jgi:hypothetical protein